ncbi:MAG: response regulator [Chitinivibrionales bacterium]|nr:response regulator [Chitinivibrionales bacterium]MBD3396293.1 response regulator [Chitinivibrionales bacterium]
MPDMARVLCVDDEPVAREVFRGIFEDSYNVLTASSGDEAMEVIRDFKPDVLILDAVMPGIDGWEVCRRAKKDPSLSNVPIIMVSAHATGSEYRHKAYAAGADDYIIKPYIHEDLLAKVQVWTRVHEIESHLGARLKELEAVASDLERTKQKLEQKVVEKTRDVLRITKDLHEEAGKRRREREENEQMKERLIHSEKMEAVGRLAGALAHDINNLLGGILGNADVLKDKISPDSAMSRHIHAILSCCARGARLVDQLLTFSRRSVSIADIVDVNEIIRELSDIVENTLKSTVRLDICLDAESAVINADAAQIHACLLNLALNARDAMPHGGTLRIETNNITVDDHYRRVRGTPISDGEYLLVRISDTGAGMAPDVRDRIFEPFFTTKQPGKGSGLGLASVCACVRNHKGHIQVESEPGKGSTFDIYLPLAAHADTVAAEFTADDLRTGTVLLVEDEPLMRDVTGGLLEEIGFSVVSAESSAEAIKHLQANPESVDIAVLDLLLPDMHGTECLDKLREIKPGLPAVVVSGMQPEGRLEEALKEPRTAFVNKPFGFADLKGAMEKVGRKE